ncbi:MAG: hypothetical protein ACKVZ6_11845 [Kineosporiaceae bacterium]|jgi:hypothetical protein
MLVKMPQSWPQPLVAVLAMALLAVLDLGGAVAAKEAVERRSPWIAALGAVLFLLLFWVYACSLQYAELAPVTFGWIVLLQVGVVLLDRFRYGVQLSTGAWVAVALILAAQAYLLLAPGTAGPEPRDQASDVLIRLDGPVPTSQAAVDRPATQPGPGQGLSSAPSRSRGSVRG